MVHMLYMLYIVYDPYAIYSIWSICYIMLYIVCGPYVACCCTYKALYKIDLKCYYDEKIVHPILILSKSIFEM